MDFLEALSQRIVLGDGAMGTELLAAGAPRGSCLEELCVSAPERVRAVHESYLAAGAQLIRTNSFGANAVRLARGGLERRVNEINWHAAQLAKEAAAGRDVFVAGSVGPLGITAAEAEAQGIDRAAVFLEQIGALLDGGCRVIFLETFLDCEELLLALNAKHSLHHCPVVALLARDDGAGLEADFAKLRAAEADVVGVNCLSGDRTRALLGSGTAAFPSAGLPEISATGELRYATTPEAFAATGRALAEQGARLIGGCCGIGPSQIAELAKAAAARAL